MRLSTHKFLIIFFAVLIIFTVLFGMSALSSRRTPSSKNDQTPYISQTPSITQNDFSISSTLTSPDTTPTTIPTSPSTKWEPLPPIYGDRALITNGDRSNLKVALTFDLCQSEGDLAGYDTEIIRVLNELQTPATFFAGGQWMRDHQTETLELAHNPLFELGNHSWSHLDFSTITVDEMKAEITLTQQFMYNLLGYQTDLFRLPYGTYNEDALNVVGENGLYTIQWDVVSGDPDPNINAESMTSWVLQQVQPGSIIIMHANSRGWHTAEALPALIQSIRQQGYTLVTVPDLLGIQRQK